jgi:hypothetical protein
MLDVVNTSQVSKRGVFMCVYMCGDAFRAPPAKIFLTFKFNYLHLSQLPTLYMIYFLKH